LFYKSRKFTNRDLQYWASLDLEEEDLKYFNTKSVKYLLEENGLVRKEFRPNELAFIYQFWDKEKLYRPEASKSFKFRNTCPGDDYRYYQGYQQLRGRKEGVTTLFITKSYKDVMVMWKNFNVFLNIPVDIIAPHAESIKLSEEFIEFAKEEYDEIICVSDFDLAGVKFANQCKRAGFKYKFVSTKRILINNKLKVIDKDIADFRLNNGSQKTQVLLKSWKTK
jgi:hypothetical protein